jgi:hypothetical protein
MRCREVKRRMIDDAGRRDPEVVEHLLTCRDCRRAAEAAEQLQQLLTKAGDDVSAISFANFRARVERTAARTSTLETIMIRIQRQYHYRPRLIAGLGLAMAVFLFLTLTPFSYTKTIGYTVTVPGGEAVGRAAPALFTAAMTAAGVTDLSVAGGDSANSFRFIGRLTESEARDLGAALIRLSGGAGEPVVVPIKDTVSGTLYAQAAEKVKADKKQPARIHFENGKLIIDNPGADSAGMFTALSDTTASRVLEKVLARMGVKEVEVLKGSNIDAGDSAGALYLAVKSDLAVAKGPAKISLDDSSYTDWLLRPVGDSAAVVSVRLYMEGTDSLKPHMILIKIDRPKMDD